MSFYFNDTTLTIEIFANFMSFNLNAAKSFPSNCLEVSFD